MGIRIDAERNALRSGMPYQTPIEIESVPTAIYL
jgi:hypothetical protein